MTSRAAASRLKLFAICAIVVSRVFAQDPICFGGKGVEESHLFACQPNAAASACCAAGDVCYSNRLCGLGPTADKGAVTPFFWDGCTDSSFKSPECFTSCFHLPGNGVKVCPNAGPNRYCCYQFKGCNCTDPSQVISIPAGIILATIDPSRKATPRRTTSSTSSTSSTAPKVTSSTSTTSRSTPTASPKIDPESSTTSISVSSHTSATSSKPSSTADETSSHTATTAPISSPISSSTGPTTSSPNPTTAFSSPAFLTQPVEKLTSNTIAIGVGVGVGVPLLLAVLALIYFLKRRPSIGSENVNLIGVPPPKPYHHELGGFYGRNPELSAGADTQYDAVAPRELPAHRTG